MKLLVIITIILIFIFIPIPIKIQIEFSNNNFLLRLYNYRIFSSKKGIENKFIRKNLSKDSSSKKKSKKIKNKKRISIKNLYYYISKNKYKPKLKITSSLTYGIEDAAICAMLYGIISNIPNLLYFLLSIIFKVKKLHFNIQPKFNTNLLSFYICSIFYFNIANIIYILYLINKCKEIKEVDPDLRENI